MAPDTVDLLQDAVVDITTLVSTGQALRRAHGDAGNPPDARRHERLRKEVRQATLAYIDKLARAKRGQVDARLLAACRLAAERQMPHALRLQSRLAQLLASQADGLRGAAAARQDLWQLARITNHLRMGTNALREAGAWAKTDPPAQWASRLRRRLRHALAAYGTDLLRDAGTGPMRVPSARQAAWRALEKGLVDAQRLARVEHAHELEPALIRQGVWRPLRDLLLDWQAATPPP
jgi:hypothetical protein